MDVLSDEQYLDIAAKNGIVLTAMLRDDVLVGDFQQQLLIICRAVAESAVVQDRAARAEPWGFVVTAANGNQQALPKDSDLLHVARAANAPMFPLYPAMSAEEAEEYMEWCTQRLLRLKKHAAGTPLGALSIKPFWHGLDIRPFIRRTASTLLAKYKAKHGDAV